MREAFLRIAAEFLQAKTESLGSHPLAQFIRRDAPAQVRRSLPPELQSLLVQGTTNPGVWAHVQWIAVMDPAITESPTRGYYVVYLFSANMRWVYLSLNQGMTAVKKEFGSGGMYGVLRNRAAAMPARLTDRDPRFSDADISLESGSEGARAYEAGHALGIEYDLANLPSQNELSKDLTEILRLYLLLRSRGGVLPIEGTDDEEAPDYRDSIKEQRRYRLHRSIERNASAAKKAKQALGYICQGCELNLERIYGPVGHKYIEAHHLTPLSELPEDSPISLDPRRDFAVLCANCHRMMHRKDGPKTVGELRELSRVPVLRQWLHEHP